MPRIYRFTLGDRLTASALDSLDNVVAASYARQKEALLEFARQRVNLHRFQLRMARDL